MPSKQGQLQRPSPVQPWPRAPVVEARPQRSLWAVFLGVCVTGCPRRLAPRITRVCSLPVPGGPLDLMSCRVVAAGTREMAVLIAQALQTIDYGRDDEN